MVDFYLGFFVGSISAVVLIWTFKRGIARAMPKRKAFKPSETWKIVRSEIEGDTVTHRIIEL